MSTDVKAKHFKLIGASTTHIAAAQTLGGAGNFTLANTTVGNLPQTITFTSTGNISGVEMTITGTDLNGDAQTEAINGPNITRHKERAIESFNENLNLVNAIPRDIKTKKIVA